MCISGPSRLYLICNPKGDILNTEAHPSITVLFHLSHTGGFFVRGNGLLLTDSPQPLYNDTLMGSVFQTAAQTSSILTFYWDHVIGVREIVFKITKIITDEIYEPKIDLP